jgi:hypothetical protein
VTLVSQALSLLQLPVHLLALRSGWSFSFLRYAARWRPCGSGPTCWWFELSKLFRVTNKAALRSKVLVLAFRPGAISMPHPGRVLASFF